MDDPIFNEKNEVKPQYNNIKFGKPGDWFKGTLTDNSRQMPNNLSAKKEMQTVFEFMAHGGSFHDIENTVVADKPTIVNKGDFWSLITGKPAILQQLKGAKLGQIVAFRFSEFKASKEAGRSPAKIIKVYLGEMDPEYQGQQKSDVF